MKKTVKFACLLTALILTGCGNTAANEKSEDLIGYKLEYEILDKDGETIYRMNDHEYSFSKKLTGRSPNAVSDSYYVVLTNDDDLTYEDVDKRFWSSYSHSDDDFIIVEWGSDQ